MFTENAHQEPTLPRWSEKGSVHFLQYTGLHAETHKVIEIVAGAMVCETKAGGIMPLGGAAQMMNSAKPTYTAAIFIELVEGTEAHERAVLGGATKSDDGRYYKAVEHKGLSREMAQLMILANCPVDCDQLDMASAQDDGGKFTEESLERNRKRTQTDREIASHERASAARDAAMLQTQMKHMQDRIRRQIR